MCTCDSVPPLCRFLCQRGAMLAAEDNSGNTALHFACASDQKDLLSWLLGIPEVKSLMDKPNKVRAITTCTCTVHQCTCTCTLSQL